MNIIVCLDDTDNLERGSTGEMASLLAKMIERQGWGKSSYVTRHQLLVHPDIPYTSHNSAMCFTAVLDDCPTRRFIDYAARFLKSESAPGSDPGLCVAQLPLLVDDERLVLFGRSAKKKVLTKEAAYHLADELGVHLSEHGGTGQGVVGALAGAGLRLGGSDGRLRGKLDFGEAGGSIAIRELLAHPLVEEIRCPEGASPAGDDQVHLNDKTKTVLLDGRSVLLLAPAEENGDGVRWRTLTRRELKGF